MEEKAEIKNPIVRIPPSPTGFMHIGTARTALFNYLFAKKYGGKIYLRIEDTDKERSKVEFEDDIIDGFSWLGFIFDNKKIIRSSEQTDAYKKYLAEMIKNGSAYVSQETEGESKEVIRFKNPNKKIAFDDLIRGKIEFDTTDLGDFVIAKNTDAPLYHLAVVVDDFEAGITHILRGEDHISNTPRQILIQEAIGAPRPVYAHIPLILAADRSKLSKRHGAVAVTQYRADGYLPEALVNYLALVGWNPGTEQEIFSMEELIEKFDISKVQKGGAIFNKEKLDWINREYIKKLSDEKISAEIKKYLPDVEESMAAKLAPLIKERINVFGDIKKLYEEGELDFYFKAPKIEKNNLICPERLRKGVEVSLEQIKKNLAEVINKLEKISDADFTAEKIKDYLWDYATENGRGVVLWAMRYALSGKEKSPDPFTLADFLGKKETISRLNMALSLL